MTQEIIRKMLELCEEHMNEGDYLESANLLKEVHKNQPNPSNYFHLEENIVIYSLGNDKYEEIARVVAFDYDEPTGRINIVVSERSQLSIFERSDTHGHEPKLYKLDLYTVFDNYIRLKLEIDNTYNIKIEGSIFPTKLIMGEKIIDSLKFIEKCLGQEDEDGYSEAEYIMPQIYRVFTENIIQIIKHTCKSIKRGGLEFK